jgi:CheY-like chemotaxis protein
MTISTVCSKNVLIVEDDKDIRESMRDALEIEGYHVTVAKNGSEALTCLHAAKSTCIILLDMLMPLMAVSLWIE